MKTLSPLNAVHEFNIVTHRLLASGEYAVLLENDGLFSVCRTQPKRMLAIVDSYDSPEGGVLTAPLNLKGLRDLLRWEDKSTADRRYSDLLKERGMPSLRLCAVPA